MWWHIPLTPAPERPQEDQEFKAVLPCTLSSRGAWASQDPVSGNKQKDWRPPGSMARMLDDFGQVANYLVPPLSPSIKGAAMTPNLGYEGISVTGY